MNESQRAILARIERKIHRVHFYEGSSGFVQEQVDADIEDIMEDVRSLLGAPRADGQVTPKAGGATDYRRRRGISELCGCCPHEAHAHMGEVDGPTWCRVPDCPCVQYVQYVEVGAEFFADALAEGRLAAAKWGPQSALKLVAALTEEVGEVARAVLKAQDERGDPAEIRAEAVQAAGILFRIPEAFAAESAAS